MQILHVHTRTPTKPQHLFAFGQLQQFSLMEKGKDAFVKLPPLPCQMRAQAFACKPKPPCSLLFGFSGPACLRFPFCWPRGPLGKPTRWSSDFVSRDASFPSTRLRSCKLLKTPWAAKAAESASNRLCLDLCSRCTPWWAFRATAPFVNCREHRGYWECGIFAAFFFVWCGGFFHTLAAKTQRFAFFWQGTGSFSVVQKRANLKQPRDVFLHTQVNTCAPDVPPPKSRSSAQNAVPSA